MEKSLQKCMEEISQVAGVTGCVLADNQGLCLVAKGRATTSSTGVITAVAQQVARLEPESRSPVILLENEDQQCLIHQNGNITAAIFKQNQTS